MPSAVHWSANPPDVPRQAQAESQARALLASLPIERKVAQLVQAEIASITPAEAVEMQIGSILNGGGSFPRSKYDSLKEWQHLADAFATSDRSDFIPILWGTDAVHGHNNLFGATLYPHNIGLGATRNFQLIKHIAEATAGDVRASGIDWTFAPTLAVPRDYRWGRTYEGFAEDPDLVAQFARAMIEGFQGSVDDVDFLSKHRVLATTKHFIGEGCTHLGRDQGDSRCTEETLWNTHAPGHICAIDAGVQIAMAAFNSWNGEKVHGSKFLLTNVLKEQLQFRGFVVSDWDGFLQLDEEVDKACAASVNAGVDMLMVSGDWQAVLESLLRNVRDEKIPVSRLDDAVYRILRVKALAGLFARELPSTRAKQRPQNHLSQAPHNLARQAVRESLVLLKNNQSSLPLNPRGHILVTGEFADSIPDQCGGWSLTWQGTDNTNADFPSGTSIYAGIAEQCKQAGGQATLASDVSDLTGVDAVVVVFGEGPYAEGDGDLEHLSFHHIDPKPLELLTRIKQSGVPVIGVLITGRPLWINPELNACDALVVAWLPGTEGGGLADVLLANPDNQVQYDFKGRLPQSWPNHPNQCILNYGEVPYEPLFELGYGLTYAHAKTLVQLSEADPTEIHPIRERSAASATYPKQHDLLSTVD